MLNYLKFYLFSDDKPLEFECEQPQVDVAILRSRIMLLNKAPSLLSMPNTTVVPLTQLSSPKLDTSLDSVVLEPTQATSAVMTVPEITPSKLPRPSPQTRSKPLHALYPTRLPVPGSSSKHLTMSSSVMKRRSALAAAQEVNSNDIFHERLAQVLDMDQSLAFAPSSVQKMSRPVEEENVRHTGYTPIKKAPIPDEDAAFVVTKKMVF